MKAIHIAVAGVALAFGGLPQAWSQTQRSGGSAVSQQYQQLSVEKAALEAEVAKLRASADDAKAKLELATKERDSLKMRVASAEAAASAAKNSGDATTHALEQSKQKLEELVGRFRELAGQLRLVEGERDRLRDSDARSTRDLDRCVADNNLLADLAGEVIDRLDHRGVATRLAEAEPFTRIMRNRVENAADEYRARAKAATQAPRAAPPAGTPDGSR